jgi:hypothetical protein
LCKQGNWRLHIFGLIDLCINLCIAWLGRMAVKKFILNAVRLAMSVLPVFGSVSASSAMMAVRPVDSQLMAWSVARSADSAEAYTRFIIENPGNAMVAEAKARLGALAVTQTAVARRMAPTIADALAGQASRSADKSFGGAARIMNI